MPIERAVPSICFIAPSRSIAFRSFIFELGDLLHLGAGHLADLFLVRHAGTLFDLGGLAKQDCRGRGLQHERERTIGVDGDLCRENFARTIRRAGIVFLAEGHDVDTMTGQRGTDGGRRVGFSSLELETNDCLKFLCHCFTPLWF